MRSFEISANRDQIRRAESLLSGLPVDIPLVFVRALNDTIDEIRPVAIRAIGGRYAAKRNVLDQKINTSHANPNRLRAELFSQDRRRNLSSFGVSPSAPIPGGRQKLRIEILRGQSHVWPSAFTIKNPNGGGRLVVSRKGTSRYPLSAMKGPSVPQMMGHPEIMDPLTARANELLQLRIDAEVSRLLSGGGV